MVLINETKYACQSCIKGHRSSGCTHTDRPLFEIKKKGRPASQCTNCRELRKTKQIHLKCECLSTIPANSEGNNDQDPAAFAAKPKKKTKMKRKDVTKAPPTFPNGLKDFHEMNSAAETLNGLGSGMQEDSAFTLKSEKTLLQSLLNPCKCKTGQGRCSCAGPSRWRDNGETAPGGSGGGSCCSSKKVASTQSPLPTAAEQGLSDAFTSSVQMSDLSPKSSLPAPLVPSTGSTPPLVPLQPLHTSRHVVGRSSAFSKPYASSTATSSAFRLPPLSLSRKQSIASFSPSDSPSHLDLRELVANFVHIQEKRAFGGAAVGEASEAVEGDVRPPLLPPFETFLRDRKEGGDSIMVSGCGCGDDCACPSCAEHGNVAIDEQGRPMEHVDCPPSCSSCFNCTAGFTVPSGLTTIHDLISASAAALPSPPSVARQSAFVLNPVDLSVLPSSAVWGPRESKEAVGLLEVPKLECCSGRCRCPEGDCSCMKDCCGCCETCDCDEEPMPVLRRAPSPESIEITTPFPMPESLTEPEFSGGKAHPHPEEVASAVSSCCSTKSAAPMPVPVARVIASQAPTAPSSCCPNRVSTPTTEAEPVSTPVQERQLSLPLKQVSSSSLFTGSGLLIESILTRTPSPSPHIEASIQDEAASTTSSISAESAASSRRMSLRSSTWRSPCKTPQETSHPPPYSLPMTESINLQPPIFRSSPALTSDPAPPPVPSSEPPPSPLPTLKSPLPAPFDLSILTGLQPDLFSLYQPPQADSVASAALDETISPQMDLLDPAVQAALAALLNGSSTAFPAASISPSAVAPAVIASRSPNRFERDLSPMAGLDELFGSGAEFNFDLEAFGIGGEGPDDRIVAASEAEQPPPFDPLSFLNGTAFDFSAPEGGFIDGVGDVSEAALQQQGLAPYPHETEVVHPPVDTQSFLNVLAGADVQPPPPPPASMEQVTTSDLENMFDFSAFLAIKKQQQQWQAAA